MSKSVKIYIVFLVLLMIGIVVIDANSPKPINWTPTYSLKDKIPLGLYVLDQEANTLFKGQEIEKVNVTPYEFLSDKFDYGDDDTDTLTYDYQIKGTILNISEFSKLDDQSVEELCNFVSYGNTAFISSKELPQYLLDSLKIKTNLEFKTTDSIYNWVANPALGTKKYKITEGLGNTYFSKIDTLNTTVLGYQSGDSTRVNFIKVKYYDGQFLLHTQPAAFTNFHLLKDDHYQYAEKVLSYIPKENIYWYTKGQNGEVISESRLRYILSQPALEWGWWIALMGIAVFMIFNAKRKQRIVPIKKPLTNTTVEFIRTIGNLYYQEGDHGTIIDKKIIYFLEKIRNEYLLDTTRLDDDFIKKLHLKSGKNIADIQKAVFLINTHRRSPNNSIEADLIQINNAIEKIIHH
ncbi:DUF4350 domain-containing protein [Flavobacterium humi]|uniref:DUF4350 domain-containing protein n=1 Tax=Flavobacterium humi TaxID=2562683 RepID=A0A4Z0L7D3_9FLAO|nr:DUF4350 domain-containing protein [Flavobacterium humi]TGD58151.1 DUF4350 domain-containing protein [Flavobacterium humi]